MMIFIMGALAGGLATKYYMRSQHPVYKRNSESRKTFLVNRLNRRLKLSPKQKKQVEQIVNKLTETLRKQRQAGRLIAKKHIKTSFAEIHLILKPAQQIKLVEMRNEFEKRRSKKKKPQRR